MRLGVSGGLGLVRNQDIDVRHDLVETFLEELSNERRRQVQNERLVLGGRLLSQSQNGLNGDSQMVAADVEELCVLDLLPDLGLLQMVHLVQIRGSEVGAQRTVVARDDDTTAAGGGLLIIAVFGLDAGFGADVFELLAILVAANAANVCGRVRG